MFQFAFPHDGADVECLFICLFTICIPSLETALVQIFDSFLTKLIDFLIVEFYIFFEYFVFCKCLLQICGLSFNFVYSIFNRSKVNHFNKVKSYHFVFFHGSHFYVVSKISSPSLKICFYISF